METTSGPAVRQRRRRGLEGEWEDRESPLEHVYSIMTVVPAGLMCVVATPEALEHSSFQFSLSNVTGNQTDGI